MTNRLIIGAGGGGKGGGSGSSGRSAVEAPDSLRSKAYVNVLDLISEGEIEGLATAEGRSIFYDGTPLLDTAGNSNFPGVSWGLVNGTQHQNYIPGFQESANTIQVNTRVAFGVPVTRRINNANIDSVSVVVAVPSLYEQNTSTGDLNGASVEFAIEIQTANSGYSRVTQPTITGKTMSRYQRQYNINLTGTGPWDVRVLRITPDSTTAALNNELWWDAYTEVVEAKLTFPNSAIVAQHIDTETFSRIPNRRFWVKGIKCKIPDNYNPATRSYTGAWSGGFQIAWTDNPAWVFYDMATNDRYGAGKWIDPNIVDKWFLYAIGQYCDTLVPNGAGGTEPRLTCNLVLSTRADAEKVLRDLAGIFRGMLYYGGGMLFATQDSPASPVGIFTNSNVVDGTFSYQGSARKTRHTACIVQWNNPALLSDPDYEYVQLEDMVARYGLKEASTVSMGCTSQGQAYRAGLWFLYSETGSTETVSFKTGLDASFAPRPGQIFEIFDQHRAGLRFGGRVITATTTQLTLDAPVTFVAGQTYSISVMQYDRSIETRTITGGVGTRSVITVTPAFSNVPTTYTHYGITSTSLTPTLWRCVAVSETDQAGVFEISGLEHNASKYGFIENGLALQRPPTSVITLQPGPPRSLVTRDSVRRSASGDLITVITASWQPPLDYVGRVTYAVEARADNENWELYSSGRSEISADIMPVRDGITYHIRISSVSAIGDRCGVPLAGDHFVIGKAAPPSDVVGLTAKQQGNVIVISCDVVLDADLDGVELRYADTFSAWDNGTVVGYMLRGESFTTADIPPGLWRIFAKAVDTTGNYSVNAAYVDLNIDSGGYQSIARYTDAGFPGQRSNVVRHPSGVLVIDSTLLASQLAFEVFDQFVPSPFGSGTYISGELNKQTDSTSRLYAQISATLGPGQVGNPVPTLAMDYHASTNAYDGFEAWSVGAVFFRYAQARLTIGSNAVITNLTLVADNFTRFESRQDEPISAPSSTISFSSPFNNPPNLQVTLTGGATAITFKVTVKTAASFTVTCYDQSGIAVAGTIDWKAEGV